MVLDFKELQSSPPEWIFMCTGRKLRYPGQALDSSFVVSMLVKTVVHKEGEKKYVVMQVQPHPSIVITHLGHVVPEGGSYIYIPCIEQQICRWLQQYIRQCLKVCGKNQHMRVRGIALQ